MLQHRLFVYTIKEHSTALLIELDETLAGAIKRIDQRHASFFLFCSHCHSFQFRLFFSLLWLLLLLSLSLPCRRCDCHHFLSSLPLFMRYALWLIRCECAVFSSIFFFVEFSISTMDVFFINIVFV